MVNPQSKLKKLRLSLGLSQNQLARLSELDRGTISAAENNKNVSDLSKARIKAALIEKSGKPLEDKDLW